MKTFTIATTLVLACSAWLLRAEDWAMGFHDAAHSGTTSEIVTPPLRLSWRFRNEDPRDQARNITLPIIYQGKVYTQGANNSNRVFCLEPSTGAQLWRYDAYLYLPLSGAASQDYWNFLMYPAAAKGRVIIGSADWSESIDANVGGTPGSYQMTYDFVGGWPCGGWAIWDGLAYGQGTQTDNSSELFMFKDPTHWVRENPAFPQAWTYGPHNYPYPINQAYDQGTLRVPAVSAGVIYENRYGRLTARNAKSNKVLWVWPKEGAFGASPAIEGSTLVIYLKSEGKLYALDTAGAYGTTSSSVVPTRWTVSIGGAYSPIVSQKSVYVGSDNGKFYALNLADGSIRWSFTTGKALTQLQIPAISGDLIYLPGSDGVLYVLRTADGSDVSRVQVSAQALGPVVIGGGRIYTSDMEAYFYSFVPASAAYGPRVEGLSQSVVSNATSNTLEIQGSGFCGGGSTSLVTRINLDDAARTALSGYAVGSDSLISGAVLPVGVAPGTYRLIVTTSVGSSLAGPTLIVQPASSFFAGQLGIADLLNAVGEYGTTFSCQRHVVQTRGGQVVTIYSGPKSTWTYNISPDGGRSWSYQTALALTTPSSYGPASALAIDEQDNIYFAYNWWNVGTYLLKFRYKGSDFLEIAPGYPKAAALKSSLGVDTNPSAPSLCCEPNGRLWLAYLGMTASINSYDVYVKYSDDAGDSWSSPIKLNTTSSNSNKPALVLWNGKPACFLGSQAGALAWTYWTGSAWAPVSAIPGPVTGIADKYSVTVSADQRIHLAYVSGGVQYRSFNGTAWSTPLNLDANAVAPSLSTDGLNLWCVYSAGGQLYYKTLSSSGVWSAATQITNGGHPNTYPATPVAARQGLPVVYTSGSGTPHFDIKSAFLPALTAYPAPGVTALAPAELQSDQSVALRITGTGFFAGGSTSAVSKIELDDPQRTQLTKYTVESDTLITGTVVPAGLSAGSYNIRVSTRGGVNRSSAMRLQVKDPAYPATIVASGNLLPPNIFNTSYAPQRHLLQMDDGCLVAVYALDDNVVRSLSSDQGKTWSTPAVLNAIGTSFSTSREYSSSLWKDAAQNVYIVTCQATREYRSILRLYKLAYSAGTLTPAAGFPKTPLGPEVSLLLYPHVAKQATGRLWLTYTQTYPHAQYSDDDGTTWTTPVRIDSQGFYYARTSIVLCSDIPYVFMSNGNNGQPSWTKWTGNAWSAPANMSNLLNYGGDFSVVATSNNTIHVAYASHGLKYTAFDGTAWSKEQLLDDKEMGLNPSLTTDGTSVWCFYTDSDLNLACKKIESDGLVPAVATRITTDGSQHFAAAAALSSQPSAIPVLWTHKTEAGNEVRCALLQAAPAAGTLQFSTEHYPVSENCGNAIIRVTRNGGASGAVSIAYSTASGSASAGSDFSAVSGTVSFASGDSTDKTISVPILNDVLSEGSESIRLRLSSPSGGAAIGGTGTATLQIVDNDTLPPQFTLSPATLQLSVRNDQRSIQSATLNINNGGNTPANWSAAVSAAWYEPNGSGGYRLGAPWLRISASAGTLPVGGSAAVSLSADPGTLPVGTYMGTLTVNVPGAVQNPQTATVVFDIRPGLPVITSASSVSIVAGNPLRYYIQASENPTSYSITGTLPAGLQLTDSLLSGVPTETGVFNLTLMARNNTGTGTAPLTLTVTPPTTQPVVRPNSLSVYANADISYQITATNLPTHYAVTNLPAGLNLNAGTGLITGTITTVGNYTCTLSASNSFGTGTSTLTIYVWGRPFITSASTATGVVGVPFTFQLTALNDPTSFTGYSLPVGLSLNTTTGLISGTPEWIGAFKSHVYARNAAGTSPIMFVTFTIYLTPSITSSLSASSTVGSPFSYTIMADGFPTVFQANGLPTGLSVNTATGEISGSPSQTGTFNVTLSASNPGATSSATLVLVVTGSTTSYAVSGKIGGAVLAGVLVSDGTRNATSDAAGNYTITGVPNGSYTLRASKAGYVFTPATLPVTVASANLANQNFTADVATYSISGSVTSGTLALAGVTVSTGSKTTTTDALGKYTLTGLPNGSYTLTASKAGYLFSPTSLAATVSGANLTGRNFTYNTLPVISSGPTATPSSASTGQSVAFSVAATDSDGDTLSYTWNFGDASTGTGSAPTHAFTAAGSYTARVVVADGKGGSVQDTVTVTVSIPTGTNTVTVMKAGLPLSGRYVYAYDTAGVTLKTVLTDSQGRATFSTLAAGLSVKYGINDEGKYFYSTVLTTPANTTITLAASTTVTVLKGGQPLSGVYVYAYDAAGASLGYTRLTDSSGRAIFAFNSGQQVSFRVNNQSAKFYSALIVTPANANISVPADSVVTVLKGGQPLANVYVYACDAAGTSLGYARLSDANGRAMFALAAVKQIKFKVLNQNASFWSALINPPGTAAINIPADSTVNVLLNGLPVAGVYVYAYDDAGIYLNYAVPTNAAGKALFAIAAGQQVKFRTTLNSQICWSAVVLTPNTATIAAATTAAASLPAESLGIALLSPPTATPNPAIVGQSVSFTVAAAASSNTLTYRWDFGDATTSTDSSASHTYLAAGVYTVTISISDGAASESYTLSLRVDALGAAAIAQETAALSVTKGLLKFNFKADKHSLALNAVLTPKQDLQPGDQLVKIAVGQYEQSLQLNDKGLGRNDTTLMKLVSATKNGSTLLKWQFVTKNPQLFSALTSLGFVNAEVAAVQVKVPVVLTVGNQTFVQSVSFTYSAAKDKPNVSRLTPK